MTAINMIAGNHGRDGLANLPLVTAPLARPEGIGDVNTSRGRRELTRGWREANAFDTIARARRTGRGNCRGPDASLGRGAASVLWDHRPGGIVMIAGHIMALTGAKPRPNRVARAGSTCWRAADLVGALPHQGITSIETVLLCTRRVAMAVAGTRGAWAAVADASMRARALAAPTSSLGSSRALSWESS